MAETEQAQEKQEEVYRVKQELAYLRAKAQLEEMAQGIAMIAVPETAPLSTPPNHQDHQGRRGLSFYGPLSQH